MPTPAPLAGPAIRKVFIAWIASFGNASLEWGLDAICVRTTKQHAERARDEIPAGNW